MLEPGSAAHSRMLMDRMREIMNEREYDALAEVLHPDFVQEMPQSGERVVGIENFRKILENMPGEGKGIDVSRDPYTAGDAEHYIVTPTFNVVKVEDRGDEQASYVLARYPDGSEWYIVTFSSFKDGKIIKRVDFYAPLFESPGWRSEWVEELK